ncbi:uncharacterized protein BDZ99DRAFT_519963 [Mytilinidion resinicola]|uniref:Uncharacterized protein n=1 Tax=Mytilinidion resinicola TaxID=574789 RepID=A0A6A6YPG2_9PEZI|nr:uncharacterized protein BDZ99DRAFT_519963 [Mytilinidion resinicola]KAF2809865.1 hypothetical protein BDZ99DRAFT_519963 [Mytilinidion resinicola]
MNYLKGAPMMTMDFIRQIQTQSPQEQLSAFDMLHCLREHDRLEKSVLNKVEDLQSKFRGVNGKKMTKSEGDNLETKRPEYMAQLEELAKAKADILQVGCNRLEDSFNRNKATTKTTKVPKLRYSGAPHLVYMGANKWAELASCECNANGVSVTVDGVRFFNFMKGIEVQAIMDGTKNALKLEKKPCKGAEKHTYVEDPSREAERGEDQLKAGLGNSVHGKVGQGSTTAGSFTRSAATKSSAMDGTNETTGTVSG